MAACDLWLITTWLQGGARMRVVIVNYIPRVTYIMSYILQPDWSLLLLVNIQGTLHCKQCVVIVNMLGSLH